VRVGRVLIRGLEPGSAYLAYLLRESGIEVDILTERPSDPLLDIPPFEPLFTLDFMREVLAVRIVKRASSSYDLIVDSCDIIGLENLRKALLSSEVLYVAGDAWLSASLSLYRSLPVPDVLVDLPVEKAGSYAEVSVTYKPYSGGDYSLCGAFRDAWGGCLYTPLRALERMLIAAEVYAAITGMEAPRRHLKLEYAVGRDIFYAAFGCKPEGKVSRVSFGELRVKLYSVGGSPRYALVQGRQDHMPWILAIYNLARAVNSAFLLDLSTSGRGAFNMSYAGHLFRALRKACCTDTKRQPGAPALLREG
jgi:hypothetical protein